MTHWNSLRLQSSRWFSTLVFGLAFAALTSAHVAAGILISEPLPEPNLQLLTNGQVFAVAYLPDGSMVFGGNFTVVNGTPRNDLAKVKADGTLDPDWNPAPDEEVHALVADSGGNVYAGGAFRTIGGLSRIHVAKLSGSGAGTVDTSWNPSAPDGYVYALAMDAAGNVYMGGNFSTAGGQNRASIAKLSGSGAGAVDLDWNPSADGEVDALALDGNGHVYAGGSFTVIGGQNRSAIAKLSDGGAGLADAKWNPSADHSVYALALDGSGHVYAGGVFTIVGGQSHFFIAKLSASGTGNVDASWNPSPDNYVKALVVDGSGSVYAGGDFSNIGGQARVGIAKLTGVGAADANWNASADGGVDALVIDASGSIYAGGSFQLIGGQQSVAFTRLSNVATVSATVDAEMPGGVVSALAAQPDGGMIVGGSFLRANGTSRRNILRLRADGTLDPDWNPTADAPVVALAIDGARVYAGGYFSTVGGQSHSHLVKLSGSGTGVPDASWNASTDGSVMSLALDHNGSLYAGGAFSAVGGQSHAGIAKLSDSGTGAVDTFWNPSADGFVFAMAIDGSGSLYVGGTFQAIGGQSHNAIAKLSASGTGLADINWNPAIDGDYSAVLALALDGSGNVYVGGGFSKIGGQIRSNIAKVSGSGTGATDAVWNPVGANFYGVSALAVDASGDVYAGGEFVTMGGQNRLNIAKLHGSGTGVADSQWNPMADNRVGAIALADGDRVFVGGAFQTIGGRARRGVAALLGHPDKIFSDNFE